MTNMPDETDPQEKDIHANIVQKVGKAEGSKVIGMSVHTVTGDLIQGNKIVNNLDEKIFKRLGLQQRHGLFLLGLVLTISLAAFGWFIFNIITPDIPKTIAGHVRIAVAGMDVQGNDQLQKIGDLLTEGIYSDLIIVTDELEKDLETPIGLWGPDWTGRIEGDTPEKRDEAARSLAQKIDANILIYGVVSEDGPETTITPSFYIAEGAFRHAEELSGPHSSVPIILEGQVNLTEGKVDDIDRIKISETFKSQAYPYPVIIQGIAYYALQKYRQALETFTLASASETAGEFERGKKVLFLLMGNAASKLSVELLRTNKRTEARRYLEEAQRYYEHTLQIDPDYARGLIGIGSMKYLRAVGNYDLTSKKSDIDIELLGDARATYRKALRAKNRPPLANVPSKIHTGLAETYFLQYHAGYSEYMDSARVHFEEVLANSKGLSGQEVLQHAQARLEEINDLEASRSSEAIPKSDISFRSISLRTQAPVDSEMPDTLREPTLKAPSGATEYFINYIKEFELSIPLEHFDLSEANRIVPGDIRKRIDRYSPFPVPASGPPPPKNMGCGGHVCDRPILIIDHDSSPSRLRRRFTITSCGWPPSELIDVSVSHSRNLLFNRQITADVTHLGRNKVDAECGFASFEHFPEIFYPEGDYTFTFTAREQQIANPTKLLNPAYTLFYKENNEDLLLYNFKADEKVRLFGYQEKIRDSDSRDPGYIELVAWKEYRVNSDGHLFIRPEDNEDIQIWVLLNSDSLQFEIGYRVPDIVKEE